MILTMKVSSITFLAGLLLPARAHYLLEVNPQSFKQGDPVKLKVNKLTSTQTLYPIDYKVLLLCQPVGGPKMDHENLGELLAGDRIESSAYVLHMMVDTYCEQLCVVNVGRAEKIGMTANKLVKAIRKSYHNNWIVDNLPAASKTENKYYESTQYWQGFPIGFVDEDSQLAYVHNHVNIEIMYHAVETEPDKYRVVRFTVQPFSIAHEFEDEDDTNLEHDDYLSPNVAKIVNPIASCVPGAKVHTDFDMVNGRKSAQLASGKVLFTYDVIWKENKDLPWASRWDIYLSMDNAVPAKIHWHSIAKGATIVLVLTAMLGAMLICNLKCNLGRYNRVATNEERAEELEEYSWEYDWKLVHADVFRPPSFSPMLLAICCGTGAQLLCMALLTIFLSALGFISPIYRGHLLQAPLLLFVFMGSVNGYVTSRLYKTFKGKFWQRITLFTALGFPGLAFAVFLIMNIIAASQGSTYAVPFFTMVILLFLWFGISTPLVFLGAYLGFRQDEIEYPVTTSSIPRKIPDQSWCTGFPFILIIGGFLPFCVYFVELYYIMASVWMNYYYVFGFLFLVFLILLIICAEITVLFTYFQLCNENYHWWWRSFCNAGATAIYIFLYSFVYFSELHANTVAAYLLYFGYMGLASLALFVMLGFVGVSSSLIFNKIIFASIKTHAGNDCVELAATR